jgi:hypothetical protein
VAGQYEYVGKIGCTSPTRSGISLYPSMRPGRMQTAALVEKAKAGQRALSRSSTFAPCSPRGEGV